jgi:hypothetical protein
MVAAVLVEEGKIDILLKNADGKCAFEIATNSEMKAACEPYVASTSIQDSYAGKDTPYRSHVSLESGMQLMEWTRLKFASFWLSIPTSHLK